MVELQDIVAAYGGAYAAAHSLLPEQHKALRCIRGCRTAALGGRADRFDCGHVHVSYNSCRNRNCPKCQALAKERWLDRQMQNLLPVPYYHVVFTLPEELHFLAFKNGAALYDLLMKTSAETVSELCRDPKYLGAQAGFTSVLHTWGQNLTLHPHVHMVVPSGGLAPCGKFRTGGGKFFVPVKVLAKKFRGKFLARLKGLQASFDNVSPRRWQALYDSLCAKSWYVYCKRPFKSPESVLRYLSRYTHRVAISNQRLLSMDNGFVSFLYKDNKSGGKSKVMRLEANEFLRRFLLHVLPPGFRKIRHFGFLAPAAKKKKLELCRKSLGAPPPDDPSALSARDLVLKLTGMDIHVCPVCSKGRLLFSSGLPPPAADN